MNILLPIHNHCLNCIKSGYEWKCKFDKNNSYNSNSSNSQLDRNLDDLQKGQKQVTEHLSGVETTEVLMLPLQEMQKRLEQVKN